MKILLISATDAIGRRLGPRLAREHEVLAAGRREGDVHVDVGSRDDIHRMYVEVGELDACVCTAAWGLRSHGRALSETERLEDMRAKLFGQINLVLIGRQYLLDGGSFTLTSGIVADGPAGEVTGRGLTSGALHSFVEATAGDLERGLRLNAVSPGTPEDLFTAYDRTSTTRIDDLPMGELLDAYVQCIEGAETGRIVPVPA